MYEAARAFDEGTERLIPALFKIQHEHGRIPEDELEALSKRLNVPLYRLEGLVGFYPFFRRESHGTEVAVCRDATCRLGGGPDFADKVRAACADDVTVHEVSCIGRCENAPACAVNEVPVHGSPDEIAGWAADPSTLPADEPRGDTPGGERPWKTDPYGSGDDHYSIARKLVNEGDTAAETIVETLKDAGLRGMGGAGFPTGMKWGLVRDEDATPKYMICNADESEPGTFKDRVILEELPHLVIEGMILGAFVIGAERGVIYLRHEYDRERKALEQAVRAAYDAGALGDDVLGSGRRFDLEVFVSPGGYILGEETALIEALEDKRGEPRNKPPYPGTHGLFGRPTLMNNVETLAYVPRIVRDGADAWKDLGEGDFDGLKWLAVSGDVETPGVYEVPMGTTVADLIEMAGGVSGGRDLLAFAPGGASSNFLPADKADTPLDFKTVADAGSMLGSGAVMVVAEGRDLLDLGVNVLEFFRNESCGKCVPCRVGSEKAAQMMREAMDGSNGAVSLELLEELEATLAETSICGLGQVAMGPMMSVIRNFPAAAEGHVDGVAV